MHRSNWYRVVNNTDYLLCIVGSVFSVSTDPSGTLACSGGQDDRGIIWKIADGSLVMECNGMSIYSETATLKEDKPMNKGQFTVLN